MKFKFHWGWGIAVFYSTFVLVMVGFLIFTRTQTVELVRDNYYDYDLTYQSHINKVTRTKELENQLQIVNVQDALVLRFPTIDSLQEVSGNIEFYKPDNQDLDFFVELSANEDNNFVYPINDLKQGKWVLKINWAINGIEYYNEEIIVRK